MKNSRDKKSDCQTPGNSTGTKGPATSGGAAQLSSCEHTNAIFCFSYFDWESVLF